jgi:outer membrane protein TolC
VGEQQRLWGEVEESARGRYSVGLDTQHDVLRAQIEKTRIEEARIEQETEAALRTAELNRLLGRAPDAEIRTGGPLLLRPLARSAADLEAEGEQLSPELKAAAAMVESSERTAAAAGRERRPALSVSAGYMNRGGLDPMWQAGVGVSLPRSKRTAAVAAEAAAEARAADALREATRLELRRRAHERLTRAVALERTIALYRDGLVPQGRAALQAALASYQAGKLPFMAVLAALTQLHTDRAATLRLIASHERLKAEIDEWGLGPAPEMPAAAGGGPSTGMR